MSDLQIKKDGLTYKLGDRQKNSLVFREGNGEWIVSTFTLSEFIDEAIRQAVNKKLRALGNKAIYGSES